MRDLISMLDGFPQRALHFRSLTEEINTITPGGKLIFRIFAALAEFERGLLIERTRAGKTSPLRMMGFLANTPPLDTK